MTTSYTAIQTGLTAETRSTAFLAGVKGPMDSGRNEGLVEIRSQY